MRHRQQTMDSKQTVSTRDWGEEEGEIPDLDFLYMFVWYRVKHGIVLKVKHLVYTGSIPPKKENLLVS